MKSLWVVVLVIAACEQHSPAPVNHAEPPPLPRDGGVAVAVIDGSFVHGAPYCPGERPAPGGTKTCTRDEDCGPQGRCYPDGVPERHRSAGEALGASRTCFKLSTPTAPSGRDHLLFDPDAGGHRPLVFQRHGRGIL